MSDTTPLEVPPWVPLPVASLARTLYAEAVMMPQGRASLRPEWRDPSLARWADAGGFRHYAEALRRFATDPRMAEVWRELYRRQGGKARRGAFVHAASEERMRGPYGCGTEDISRDKPGRERLQDRAAAVLFNRVTGFFGWDPEVDVGPRTRTLAEIEQEIARRDGLAASLEASAEGFEQAGDRPKAGVLRRLAASTRKETELFRPYANDPFLVQRKSDRIGDAWVRGFIIEATATCLLLFGKKMPGVVAILANIAFGRTDITQGQVQGVVKHIPSGGGPGPDEGGAAA